MIRNKYGNKKVRIEGYTFDSQAEAQRFKELRLLMVAGEITDLVIHPRYELQPAFTIDGRREQAIIYAADFQYRDRNGLIVIEDVKGMRTPVYMIKRKMLLMRIKRGVCMTATGEPVINPVFREIAG